jgi:hypothetical protein
VSFKTLETIALSGPGHMWSAMTEEASLTRFILHVGDPKCGSSSIQTSLFHGREGLRAQRILYESQNPPSGNYCLTTLIGGSTRGDDGVQMGHARNTVAKLASARGDADHIILSAENFIRQPPEDILSIVRMIDPDVQDVDVVAYVRHPAAMYLSQAQQAIKASTRFIPPGAYRRPIHEALERWENSPDVASVTVRLFDRNSLTGGDVVADFQSVLRELTDRHVTLPAARANRSLSAEQMVTLQYYRGHYCAEYQGKATPGSMRLIELFEAMNAEALVGTRARLNGRARALVEQGNINVIRWLRNHHGLPGMGERPRDAKPVPPGGDWTSIASILERVDQPLVDLLKRLLPCPDSGQPRQDEAALFSLIDSMPDKVAAIDCAVRAYWRDEVTSWAG